jgi:glucan 1,3-beta-glucosidase
VLLVRRNLPQGIGQPNLESWYAQVYSEMRTNITGLGAGKGSIMSVHEGFLGLSVWESFLQGADRLFWDVHPYIAFSGNCECVLLLL